MADELIEFLVARILEKDVAARATTPVPIPGQWCASRDKHAPEGAKLRLVQGRDPYEGDDWNQYESGEYNGTPIIAFSAEWHDEAEANLRHITYWDPARVLADLAVKRSVIEDYLVITANAATERATGDEVKAAAYELAGKCLYMVLRRFAQADEHHPDFNPAWKIAGSST